MVEELAAEAFPMWSNDGNDDAPAPGGSGARLAGGAGVDLFRAAADAALAAGARWPCVLRLRRRGVVIVPAVGSRLSRRDPQRQGGEKDGEPHARFIPRMSPAARSRQRTIAAPAGTSKSAEASSPAA